MLSVQGQIIEDLRDILVEADLPGVPFQRIKIRELPLVEEVLDQVPCVILAPFGKVEIDNLASEGLASRIYGVEIALVDGHEGDYATDLDKRQEWLEMTIAAIQKEEEDFRYELPNVPSLWALAFETAQSLDRAKLSALYAYESVIVRCHCTQ